MFVRTKNDDDLLRMISEHKISMDFKQKSESWNYFCKRSIFHRTLYTACGVRRWFLFQLVLLLTKIKQGNWDENVHFTPI